MSSSDIISLWNTVRFPLLTTEFVRSVVISSDQFMPYISQTESFLVAEATYHYLSDGKTIRNVK